MIARLHGEVAHRDATSVVVDVGGVGYLVHVTPSEHIPARGGDVTLHTSLQVREESMTLYGFSDRASLALFELLLSSSGVGPKLALAALATHRPEVLRTAIAGGDVATLTAVPGIGKKVAERLVLELADRMETVAPAPTVVDVASGGAGDGAAAEVRDALFGLGYSAAEVQAALAEARSRPGADDTSQLLRESLRLLGSGALEAARS